MTIADVRPGLRARLLGDATISSRVGGERIYSVVVQQGVKDDSIVMTRISGQGDHHMEGPSGLSRPRVQIDCWSKTIDAAASLADLVKDRLDGFRGTVLWGDNSPAEAIDIRGIFFDSEREDYDDVLKLFRVSRDYLVWHAER